MPVLTVSQLTKSYGMLRAVDGISFHIDRGDIYGLLGPNGAGKTTTIDMIATLLRPDAGEVDIQSAADGSDGDVRWKIGLVPQKSSLTEKLTGRECLRFFGRLYDLRGRNLCERVERRLKDVGLEKRGDDRVSTYSGGMQRRLNIAAGLLHDPALLLMDEPTAGVDPQSRSYIFDIVEQLAADGVSILYTTHYMEEAQRLCRRIGVMDHGHILAEGTLAELIEHIGACQAVRIQARKLDEAMARALAGDLGNARFELADDSVTLFVANARDALPAAVRSADQLGITLQSVTVEEPNLETVFLNLTGRALRD